MTENDIKKIISENKTRERSYAKTISELYPERKGVHVKYKVSYSCFAGHAERSNEYCLTPDDKLCIQVTCPNRDCTQGYFSLTSEASDCLSYGRKVEGRKLCQGKEDFKYYDHSGFTCQTELEFELSLIE